MCDKTQVLVKLNNSNCAKLTNSNGDKTKKLEINF